MPTHSWRSHAIATALRMRTRAAVHWLLPERSAATAMAGEAFPLGPWA